MKPIIFIPRHSIAARDWEVLGVRNGFWLSMQRSSGGFHNDFTCRCPTLHRDLRDSERKAIPWLQREF